MCESERRQKKKNLPSMLLFHFLSLSFLPSLRGWREENELRLCGGGGGVIWGLRVCNFFQIFYNAGLCLPALPAHTVSVCVGLGLGLKRG